MLVFSKEAIQTLEDQGLGLQEKVEANFILNCKGVKKTVNQFSYVVSSGFVDEVPLLYMNQLFVEGEGTNIVIFSHSTESPAEWQTMTSSLKTIRCI